MRNRFTYCITSGISAALISGIFIFSVPASSSRLSSDQDTNMLLRGKRIFEISCAPCHGKTGKGNGPLAANTNNFPRDLTTGVYKNRSTASGQLPTDYDLYRTVTIGIHNSVMPGFRQISPAGRWAVVQFIKTLSDRFADSLEYPLDTVMIGNPVISSPRSLSQGRKIYLEMKCADCHGVSGKGDGTAAFSQVTDAGKPVPTTDLTSYSHYKFCRNVQDVYRIFSTGLNGVPMPSYKDILSEKDRWDLANYVWALHTTDQYPSTEAK